MLLLVDAMKEVEEVSYISYLIVQMRKLVRIKIQQTHMTLNPEYIAYGLSENILSLL